MSDIKTDELSNSLLNKMRAAVLGANDGIVSTASVVMGVAGATNNHQAIVTAGLAALLCCCFLRPILPQITAAA